MYEIVIIIIIVIVGYALIHQLPRRAFWRVKYRLASKRMRGKHKGISLVVCLRYRRMNLSATKAKNTCLS